MLGLQPAILSPSPTHVVPALRDVTLASDNRLASAVPDLRQSADGVAALRQVQVSARYDANHPAMRIYHPAQAPSAVATENALMARSMMAPLYVHDSAASRIARLSNPFRDAPRFGGSVNLVA